MLERVWRLNPILIPIPILKSYLNKSAIMIWSLFISWLVYKLNPAEHFPNLSRSLVQFSAKFNTEESFEYNCDSEQLYANLVFKRRRRVTLEAGLVSALR